MFNKRFRPFYTAGLGSVLCLALMAGPASRGPAAEAAAGANSAGAVPTTAREHWAFHTPIRPELPEVRNSDWPRTPVDYFILARLEKEGLQPSAEADRVTLLRRLSLDLIGLPPTIAEVDAFLADASTNAWEKQVERLLASPHYGERW